MRRGLLLAGLLLLASGCTLLPAHIDPPRISIASLDIASGGVIEQTYRLRLRIQNPNNFDLPVDGMEYDLNVNGQHFATGVSNRSFTVPRFGTSLVEVPAVSNLFSLFQQLRELRSGWHPSYRLSGQLYLGDESRLPFDQRGEVGRGS